MASDPGWEPIPLPDRKVGREAFVVGAFTRLARTHACSAAGDGALAIALAGSLFFSLDYNAARWRVVTYLVLTLAPFSVVAPLIGPAIDRARGGARWIMIGSLGGRTLVALLMIGHLKTFLLFPEAFAMLVMGKGYQVAKSAYLPTTVTSDQALVASNSKLALLSALSTAAGAIPAVVASRFLGAPWAVAVAMAFYGLGTAFALRVPESGAAPVGAPTEQERRELSSAGVRVASSAMGMLRAAVGFLTLWIAFELRARQASSIEFALILGPIGAGAIVGSAVAPRIRKMCSEEWMLLGALAVTAATGVLGALIGGLPGAALVGAGVAVVSSSAKLAFDSLVQRDAPHADHGRAFATYEARFQLLWVVGALTGVLLPLPLRLGFLVVAAGAVAAGALVVAGRRAIATGAKPPRLGDLYNRVANDPTPIVRWPRRPADAEVEVGGEAGVEVEAEAGEPDRAADRDAAQPRSRPGDGDRATPAGGPAFVDRRGEQTAAYADPTRRYPYGAAEPAVDPAPDDDRRHEP